MAAAESPLVPGSEYAGGALIAVDPNGQEAKLELRKYHLDVHIEDGFARTTIDQTYFNHEYGRLEGTFHFPLPPDAALSRLAMYVNGTLMEGGMAERDHARNVFETIRFTQRDPALLEWVDGTTFKMRVFPLEGRQEKRIVLSYTQRLPVNYGRSQYRFPSGHSLDTVRDWSFQARVKNGAILRLDSPTHPDHHEPPRTARPGPGRHAAPDVESWTATWSWICSIRPGEQASASRRRPLLDGRARTAAGYLMVRYRPDQLPAEARRGGSGATGSSSSSRPATAIRCWRGRRSTSSAACSPTPSTTTPSPSSPPARAPASSADEPRPVTPQNIAAAVEFLEGTHLIGALDLGGALTEGEPFLKSADNTYLVHVGSGIAAMGERREDARWLT